MVDALSRAIHQEMRKRYDENENLTRWLLGQWVSELEPTLAVSRDTGMVFGLCYAGKVVIRVAPPFSAKLLTVDLF